MRSCGLSTARSSTCITSRVATRRASVGTSSGRTAGGITGKSLGHVVMGHAPEAAALVEQHAAEICYADTRGILQHGLEHGLQLAGRAGDDAEHLGGRSFSFDRLGEECPCLGKLLRVCFEFISKAARGSGSWPTRVCAFVPVERRPRTRGVALRPLARQGHLVGTVTGPFRVGGSRPRDGGRYPNRTPPGKSDHRHRRLLRVRRKRPDAAAPPSSVVNSRRLMIRSPRRRGQAAGSAH